MEQPVILREDPAEGVALVRLNRPEALNALSIELFRSLDRAVGQLEADPEVRAIVLAGAGGRAFSAGYDIHEMEHWDEDQALLGYLEREPYQWHVSACAKPTIAAVTGLAYGGGAVLAIGCDIRVGGPTTRFKVTAANYGGVNASWSLPPVVGLGVAKEWLMTGRAVEADEALAAGLLNRLVPDDEVETTAIALAVLIAANPSAGTQAVKALVNASVGRTLETAHRAESSIMATTLRPGRIADLFTGFLSERR
jgi:enoyl-CoA hydratase/carnithine racemase